LTGASSKLPLFLCVLLSKLISKSNYHKRWFLIASNQYYVKNMFIIYNERGNFLYSILWKYMIMEIPLILYKGVNVMSFLQQEQLYRVEITEPCNVLGITGTTAGYLPSPDSFKKGHFGTIPVGTKG
jgi:hypothetical protein